MRWGHTLENVEELGSVEESRSGTMAEASEVSLEKAYTSEEEQPGFSRIKELLKHGIQSLPRALKDSDVEYLRPVHKQMIALSAAGMKNREIAGILDTNEEWVSRVLRHPEAQALRNEMVAEYVTALHGDARELIAGHTKEAILTVIDLMRQSKDTIKLAAAKDILDRGGFKPQERIVSTNINLSASDAAAIQAALHEMHEEVPELREAEVTAAVFTEKRESGHS